MPAPAFALLSLAAANRAGWGFCRGDIVLRNRISSTNGVEAGLDQRHRRIPCHLATDQAPKQESK